MRKLFALTKRNLLELLRDPIALILCIGFPTVMLVFMQLIFKGFEYVPANFAIENYSVGVCVFGYTFTALFVALSVSGDKNTSFIKRLAIAPVNKLVYYLSYLFSSLPIILVQSMLFFAIALAFGLPFDYNVLLALLCLVPSAILYISLGVLFGSICKNEKQTGPISSIFISATGILGGVFMPIEAFSGIFGKIVNLLPFTHTVKIASDLYVNTTSNFFIHFTVIVIYVAVIWLTIFLVEKLKKK